MKYVIAAFILIHGLIHFMGFAKAFQYGDLKQLTLPISKPMGLLWMATAILFIATAVLYLLEKESWPLFAIPAIVVSQLAIILSWQDAKFGTIANVILLIAALIGFASNGFYKKYLTDAKAGLQQKAYFQDGVITEADLLDLPQPVQKYLRYTGSVGKPKVNNFKIVFDGNIRKNEQSEWMPFTSEQYNFMETPSRLFFMKAVMKKLPVTGYHRFNNGNAYMDIRLFSLFQVQYQDGPEMDKAETVTFFNDMCCMAPPTLIDNRITWREIDKNTVQATFTNNGITIIADLYFNESGQLINFKSNDRYNADAGKKLPWATPLKNYKPINGYNLAGSAEAIYTYPDRDFCYGTFETKSVRYNCTEDE